MNKIVKFTVPLKGRLSDCLLATVDNAPWGECVSKSELRKHLTMYQLEKLNKLNFEECGIDEVRLRLDPEIIRVLQVTYPKILEEEER